MMRTNKHKWPVPSKGTTASRYAGVYRVYEQVIRDMNSGAVGSGQAPLSGASVGVILGEVEQRLNGEYDVRHIYRIVRTVQQHYSEFFKV
jgi:hypothetical protein